MRAVSRDALAPEASRPNYNVSIFSSYHLRRRRRRQRRRDFHRVGRDAAGSDSGHGFAQGLLVLREEQSNFTYTFISFSCAEKELLCSFQWSDHIILLPIYATKGHLWFAACVSRVFFKLIPRNSDDFEHGREGERDMEERRADWLTSHVKQLVFQVSATQEVSGLHTWFLGLGLQVTQATLVKSLQFAFEEVRWGKLITDMEETFCHKLMRRSLSNL